MYTILVVAHVLVSLALIILVLVQHGKGADAGAAFGSGASGTVFGSRGSANFLTRLTAWLAAAFFALSLALAYFVTGRHAASGSVVDGIPAAADTGAPEIKQIELPPATAPAGDAPAAGTEPQVPAAPAAAAPAAEAAPEPAKPQVP
ncbi:preprotein translocase subunit SecG [Nevskia sp.]|uniref:preprotein translocase subunit SecG n=2 Tax=Gammaproteobacteria TaxID=1236 RepID=UPI0025CB879A|nr:preprotein translocase subunit SecG [Nevskia sp.]